MHGSWHRASILSEAIRRMGIDGGCVQVLVWVRTIADEMKAHLYPPALRLALVDLDDIPGLNPLVPKLARPQSLEDRRRLKVRMDLPFDVDLAPEPRVLPSAAPLFVFAGSFKRAAAMVGCAFAAPP